MHQQRKQNWSNFCPFLSTIGPSIKIRAVLSKRLKHICFCLIQSSCAVNSLTLPNISISSIEIRMPKKCKILMKAVKDQWLRSGLLHVVYVMIKNQDMQAGILLLVRQVLCQHLQHFLGTTYLMTIFQHTFIHIFAGHLCPSNPAQWRVNKFCHIDPPHPV